MNEIERLHTEYERFVRTPWDRTLAGAQKVWFAIYDPAQERRLRLRIPTQSQPETRGMAGCRST